MRKQDRIAKEREQNQTHQESDRREIPLQDRERMRGRAEEEPPRPRREPGKLPLPD